MNKFQAQKPLSETEKQNKMQSYGSIKLNFGKYKDRTIEDVKKEDEKYLKWLKATYKTTEQTSPTMKAILKYCDSI